VISFMPRPLYSRGNLPRCPLDRWLGGPQNRPGSCGEAKNHATGGIRTPAVQCKVKLSLCLINYALCHEDIWGSGCIAPPFLASALDGGEWTALRSGRVTPGERPPGSHWIGAERATELVWALWRREKSWSLPGIQPRPSSP
jgi:hypothetical protein